ncbi:MAG: hypothetical protein AAF328_10025 [Planctomycetota bacterium]
MGCHVQFLQALADAGHFPRGASVLDFGTQRLLGTREEVAHFFDTVTPATHGPGDARDALLNDPRLPEHLIDLAEALHVAGCPYLALDVCPGAATRIFDLNRERLPEPERGTFDVVLNFGTTEHLLGQDHAFRVAHEAVKVGGVIAHQLPCVGYLGHGYFSYHPMLFRDLADANGYDLLALWLTGPQGDPARPVLTQFEDEDPATLAPSDRTDCDAHAWQHLTQRDGVLNVWFRKTSDAPFARPLEVRTATQHAFENTDTDANEVSGDEDANVGSVPIYLTADRDLTRVPLRRLIRELGVRVGRKLRHPSRGSTDNQ